MMSVEAVTVRGRATAQGLARRAQILALLRQYGRCYQAELSRVVGLRGSSVRRYLHELRAAGQVRSVCVLMKMNRLYWELTDANGGRRDDKGQG